MHDQILSMITGNSWSSIKPTGKHIRRNGRADTWRKPEDTLEKGTRSFSREILGSWVPHSQSKMKRPNSRVGSNPWSHRQHVLWHKNFGERPEGVQHTQCWQELLLVKANGSLAVKGGKEKGHTGPYSLCPHLIILQVIRWHGRKQHGHSGSSVDLPRDSRDFKPCPYYVMSSFSLLLSSCKTYLEPRITKIKSLFTLPSQRTLHNSIWHI